jgi:hypothetical protein
MAHMRNDTFGQCRSSEVSRYCVQEIKWYTYTNTEAIYIDTIAFYLVLGAKYYSTLRKK